MHGSGQQGFLNGVLAGVELAVPLDQHAEHLRRYHPQQVFDLGHRGVGRTGHISEPASSMMALTSMTPPSLMSGQLCAISVARSRLSQSTAT